MFAVRHLERTEKSGQVFEGVRLRVTCASVGPEHKSSRSESLSSQISRSKLAVTVCFAHIIAVALETARWIRCNNSNSTAMFGDIVASRTKLILETIYHEHFAYFDKYFYSREPVYFAGRSEP